MPLRICFRIPINCISLRHDGPYGLILEKKRHLTLSGVLCARSRPASRSGVKVGGSMPGPNGEPTERVMRTVFLPTQNADMLLLKIESLQAQLNEQVRSSGACLSGKPCS